MRIDHTEAALEELGAASPETPDGRKIFIAALGSKSYRVVAAAARLADNLRATDPCREMAEMLGQLLRRGDGADKGCSAMEALARALASLDHDDADLYLRGMKYVQMEGSWGPPVDTAVELRAVCAMGLANSSCSEKFKPLIDLLVDREWGARAGAVRALAAIGSDPARFLPHYKARLGDDNPEVLSQCLEALLTAGDESALELATRMATNGAEESREAAVLALGASRRADAVAWLIEKAEAVVYAGDRACLLLALSSSRTEAALEYLLALLRTGSSATFAQVREALAIHRRDAQLSERMEAAIRERNQRERLG